MLQMMLEFNNLLKEVGNRRMEFL